MSARASDEGAGGRGSSAVATGAGDGPGGTERVAGFDAHPERTRARAATPPRRGQLMRSSVRSWAHCRPCGAILGARGRRRADAHPTARLRPRRDTPLRGSRFARPDVAAEAGRHPQGGPDPGRTGDVAPREPPRLRAIARRHRGVHLPRSPWVFEVLTGVILQQRITFRDAARARRILVHRLGAAAPGPGALLLPLAPPDWLRLTSEDFRRAGIDGQRARALRAAARHARRIDAAFDLNPARACEILAAVPGCGPWTVEMTMGLALGDPDAVPIGDLHPPSIVRLGPRRRAPGRRPPHGRATGALPRPALPPAAAPSRGGPDSPRTGPSPQAPRPAVSTASGVGAEEGTRSAGVGFTPPLPASWWRGYRRPPGTGSRP